jgi:hypothetical protein
MIFPDQTTLSRHRGPLLAAFLAALLAGPSAIEGQRIFHSTQSANLQTTETLRSGNWLFEISHRFSPPISNGSESLWGFDGPVNNRFGIAWAPANGLLVGVQRTNLEDNFELYGKARLLQGTAGSVPLAVAVMAGSAWNTQVAELQGAEDGEFQAYAQLIANALLLDGKLAVGVVPSWLYNPRLRDFEALNSLAVGIAAQWYLTPSMSLLGEWIVSETVTDSENDSGTFGMEFETRGHFFKLVVTNQDRMHPTQYLAGSIHPFDADNLRLGFNITRLLPF